MDIKETVKANINRSHEASHVSRYGKKGLSYRPAKLNGKNFDRLMTSRGLSKGERTSLKKSMDLSRPMEARHAKAGEQFITTHGQKNSSGIFVSKESLGKTPESRIDRGALPPNNSAKYETRVILDKNQDIISGKINKQESFQQMDPKRLKRHGGGKQVITNGGYAHGAVINRDPKFPIPSAKEAVQQKVNSFQKQQDIQRKTHLTNKEKVRSLS